ncbi:MAG: hypothetical protein ABIG43_03460 [Chloroflexota bacterium]
MIENSNIPSSVKPSKVQAISIMMLVNGILNVIYGLGLTFSVVVGTVGIGLLCSPVTILPTVLGIFEIIAATRLLSTPPRRINVQTLAILEICTIITGDIISCVIGILNLVFYNDPETKAYMDSLPK